MSILAHVGIDSHVSSLCVSVFAEGTKEPEPSVSLVNAEKDVKRFFKKLAESYTLRCCYEASVCGYVLQRWLTEIGVSCEVIAPSLVPQRPGDKVKTDRRDARKLAKLYRAGLLTCVHIPTPAEEAARGLVRLRETFLKDVVQAKNWVQKFLTRHGRRYDGKSHWTIKHWQWVKSQSFELDDQFEYALLLASLDAKITLLAQIDERVTRMADEPRYVEIVKRLCSLRGVGLVTAMTLVTEVIDFSRFRTARALMSYFGLVPKENSSGETRKQSGITKTGSSHARRVLVEAAWKYMHKPALGAELKRRQEGVSKEVQAHSWKAQLRLHKKYWSIALSKHRGKAAVAVARELTGFVWAIANSNVVLAN
jgi:transposase